MVSFNKKDYTEAILATIAAAGILSVGLIAPNAVQMFAPILRKKKKYNPTYYLKQKLQRLVSNGMVVVELSNDIPVARLTDKGQYELQKLKLKHHPQDTFWDGKYRLVIFDVKEKRRATRDALRRELFSFGFYRLQNSVWVYPYECRDYVDLLKADLRIGKDILYIESDFVENDWLLKKVFGLNSNNQ